jgi:beta-glucuronidase
MYFRKSLAIAFLGFWIASLTTLSAKRSVTPLDGEWRFCADSLQQGGASYRNGLPATAKKVHVPHTWNVMDGLETYAGLAWYEYTLPVPASDRGKDLRLKFHAIYRDATVYLNGKKVGEHLASGYNAFYIDISNVVKYGKDNQLVLSVSNEFSARSIPYQRSFDWANDGGIIRAVELMAIDPPSVRYAHASSKNTGEVSLDIKLWETPKQAFICNVVIRERKSGREVASLTREIAKNRQQWNESLHVANPALWHFDRPELYDLQVTTSMNGEIKDTYHTHFGFKEMKVAGEKLFLNGETVRLMGIEWMPGSHPDYGMAEPHSYIDGVLKDLKEVNCVITRFHWQQDEYTLDRLDEMGILVQEEVPWWQLPGNLTPETRKIVEYQLEEMIEAHYNHPCIFAWGISNEVSTGTQPQQYVELRRMIEQADSNRFVQIVEDLLPVRKEKGESLLGAIPTWNEYIGTHHTKSRDDLKGAIQTVKEVIGNRPVMITENGLCEPVYAGGDAYRIDEMNFHIREWAKHDWIAAAIYFSLNDYRTQMGEEGEGRYKRRIHGITGLYRERKPSYYTLKEMSSPIEILNVSQVKKSYVIFMKNKNTLPSYTLAGYRLVAGNKTIPLPVLLPGESIRIELPEGATRFAIERPNGHNVLTHIIQE